MRLILAILFAAVAAASGAASSTAGGRYISQLPRTNSAQLTNLVIVEIPGLGTNSTQTITVGDLIASGSSVGTRTLWVESTGNDTYGEIGNALNSFASIDAARAAANSANATNGQTYLIMVGNGTFTITNPIAGSNLAVYVPPGTTICMTNSLLRTNSGTVRSIVDDLSGPIRVTIAGAGNFIYDAGVPEYDQATFAVIPSNTGIKGGVYLQNSNSFLSLQGNQFGIRSYHLSPVEGSAFWIANCASNNLRFNDVIDLGFGVTVQIGLDDFGQPYTVGSAASGTYWELGDVYAEIGICKVSRYPIYGSQPSGSTHRAALWYRGFYLTNAVGASLIYLSGGGTSPGWKSWIDILAAENSGATAAYSGIANGTHYLRAMKLMGGNGLAMQDNGSGVNKSYITVQKITATSGKCMLLEGANSGTEFNIDGLVLDAQGGVAINTTGGSGYIKGFRSTQNARGIVHQGGTYKIQDSSFGNPNSTLPPLTVDNSGLSLQNTALINSNSIASGWTSQSTNNTVNCQMVWMSTALTSKTATAIGPAVTNASIR